MPNIANVLKEEIARVARKEVRSETTSIKKAVAAYRGEIAALKRRAHVLEQELRLVGKSVSKAAPAPIETTSAEAVRFSAKGFASNRRRLGLSAEDCGLLIGASGQSVYNWEAGEARPKSKYLPAIAGLRSIGKKEAAVRLAALREST